MSEFFCPVCDHELPGPLPRCPECQSLTGFTPPEPPVGTPTSTAPIGAPPTLAAPLGGAPDPAGPAVVADPAVVAEGTATTTSHADDPTSHTLGAADPGAAGLGSGPLTVPPMGTPTPPPPPQVVGPTVPPPPPPKPAGPTGPGSFVPIPGLQPTTPSRPLWKQPKVIAGAAIALVLIVVLIVVTGGSDDEPSDVARTTAPADVPPTDASTAPTDADTTAPVTTEAEVAPTDPGTTESPATTSPPTSTSSTSTTTSTTTTLPPTTTTEVLEMRGGDDFPGTPIVVGTALRSQVDQSTRPQEVFAIDLVAGQRIRVTLTMPGGGSIALVNPGALALTQSYSTALSGGTDNNGVFKGNFVAAIAGTYALVVSAGGSSEPYRLEVVEAGAAFPALQGTDDLPGAAVVVGTPVRSVVDEDTRPREVYAADLVAGQQVRVSLSIPGTGSLMIVNPGALSLNQSYTSAVSGGTDNSGVYTTVFTPAVSGTYSFVVSASTYGETYNLQLTALGSPLPANQGTQDFPGTPIALGTTVRSIVDEDTRRFEVYDVALTAGQAIKLTLNVPLGGSVELVDPGGTSVKESYRRAFSGGTSSGKFVGSYTPATTGTYSVIVSAGASGAIYDFIVEPLGAPVPALVGNVDIPGVPVTPTSVVQSVVDQYTRPSEVYSLDLAAGQQVKVTLDMPNGGSIFVTNPGAVSLQQSYTKALSGGTNGGKFVGIIVPAVGGTYSIVVSAGTTGQPYTLTLGPP
jgi:hypothetical protein